MVWVATGTTKSKAVAATARPPRTPQPRRWPFAGRAAIGGRRQWRHRFGCGRRERRRGGRHPGEGSAGHLGEDVVDGDAGGWSPLGSEGAHGVEDVRVESGRQSTLVEQRTEGPHGGRIHDLGQGAVCHFEQDVVDVEPAAGARSGRSALTRPPRRPRARRARRAQPRLSESQRARSSFCFADSGLGRGMKGDGLGAGWVYGVDLLEGLAGSVKDDVEVSDRDAHRRCTFVPVPIRMGAAAGPLRSGTMAERLRSTMSFVLDLGAAVRSRADVPMPVDGLFVVCFPCRFWRWRARCTSMARLMAYAAARSRWRPWGVYWSMRSRVSRGRPWDVFRHPGWAAGAGSRHVETVAVRLVQRRRRGPIVVLEPLDEEVSSSSGRARSRLCSPGCLLCHPPSQRRSSDLTPRCTQGCGRDARA